MADIFDQVFDNDNGGFSEDGDLDLSKMKLGSKKEEDKGNGGNGGNNDTPELDENDNPVGTEYDDDGNPTNLDDEGKLIETPELDENDNPVGTEYDDDGNPTNLNENGELIIKDEKDEHGNPEGTEYDDDGNPTNLDDEGKLIVEDADDDGFGISDKDIEDKSSSSSKVSFAEAANDLAEIISFDENDEEITKDVFVNKVKSALENASKKLDKTKYDPAIVRVIEHLEADPENIRDFYQNDTIRNIDGFLSMDKEAQIKRVITNELKANTPAEELQEAVDLKISEMTEKEIDAKLNGIKAQLSKAKKTEFEKITQESQDFKVQKQKEQEAQVKKERETLVSQVDKLTNFMGQPVNDRTRKFIKNEIMNGNFDKLLDKDVANVKIHAYFYKKFGSKVLSNFESKMTEEALKSFKQGTEKRNEVKHNKSKKGASSRKAPTTGKGGFDGLKGMIPEDDF